MMLQQLWVTAAVARNTEWSYYYNVHMYITYKLYYYICPMIMVHGALALIETEIKMPATSKKNNHTRVHYNTSLESQTGMIYFISYYTNVARVTW